MTAQKIFFLLFILITPPVSYAQDNFSTGTRQETIGFGLGALIGGLIAGPPGVVIGATGGTLFGHKHADTKNKFILMEEEILKKDIAIADLRQRLSDQKIKYLNTMRTVKFENRQSIFNKLKQGVSYVVYFRTDQTGINDQDRQNLEELSKVIMDIPEIRISIDAHADPRGNASYNYKLSQDRARNVAEEFIKSGIRVNRIYQHAYGETRSVSGPGDHEAYYFDRRVEIKLTSDTRI